MRHPTAGPRGPTGTVPLAPKQPDAAVPVRCRRDAPDIRRAGRDLPRRVPSSISLDPKQHAVALVPVRDPCDSGHPFGDLHDSGFVILVPLAGEPLHCRRQGRRRTPIQELPGFVRKIVKPERKVALLGADVEIGRALALHDREQPDWRVLRRRKFRWAHFVVVHPREAPDLLFSRGRLPGVCPRELIPGQEVTLLKAYKLAPGDTDRTVPSLDRLGLLAETDLDSPSLGLRDERHGTQRYEERDGSHVAEIIAKRLRIPLSAPPGTSRLGIPLNRPAPTVYSAA